MSKKQDLSPILPMNDHDEAFVLQLKHQMKAHDHHAHEPFEDSKCDRYINRELSWLEFNHRVLEEAMDRSNPLLERLNFLTITQSNLDEFFMVRVASINEDAKNNPTSTDLAGLTPAEQLAAISRRTHSMTNQMYDVYNDRVLKDLKHQGFCLRQAKDLSAEQKKQVEAYFDKVIYPILTPIAVDSGRPFPLVYNQMLNIAVLLRKKHQKNDVYFSTMQVPQVLPRLYVIEEKDDAIEVMLIETIIECMIDRLFRGFEVIQTGFYRIMRDADLDIDEDRTTNLLTEIEEQIRLRDWGDVIKLEVNSDMDLHLLSVLATSLKVQPQYVYGIDGPLDLTFLNKIKDFSLFKQTGLVYPKFEPQPAYMYEQHLKLASGQTDHKVDIFKAISMGDFLIHHPYETFEPVLDFVKSAARDPQVLAIKQTLYRVSGHSPIIQYLAEAARNGKQVFVLVELKARFDEKNNIHWARWLEKQGCHVIYGLVGLKTHSKITLVVRQERTGLRRYIHMSTGNYNDQTARVYTDLGFFTCEESFTKDASEFFNMLSGFSTPKTWHKLIVAPTHLKSAFLSLIGREVDHAKAGKPARIIAKFNALVDRSIIDALYEASCAGVQIDLIVRGICCLRPGVPHLSENIRVRSIVGRYLEHARIYYFENDGQPQYYLSSADWMPRNLERRIELLFPIDDESCKQVLMRILLTQLSDNQRSRICDEKGHYERVNPQDEAPKCDAQIIAMEAACQHTEILDRMNQNASECLLMQDVVW